MTNPDWAERLQRTRKREYDKGVEAERSRIIKLLEDSKCECASLSVEDWVKSITERGNFLKHVVCGSEADTIDEAIALIKGEQE